MDTGILIIIIVLSVVVFIDLVFFILASVCDRIAFGKRGDKNPLLKYFTAEDFNLTAQPVTVEGEGGALRGYIYTSASVQDNGKLIVFCHGMGPGHIAYTTEIAYFCNCGYTVLAVDNYGCNLSDGKNIRGMYSGALSTIRVIDFARTDERLKDKPLHLVGHSWGGYSALCASAERKVDKVVAISAPSVPSNVIWQYLAKMMPKPIAAFISYFITITYCFKFKGKGNTNAAKCASANGVPTLLIQGDKDEVVGKSVAAYYEANGGNITKFLAEGKAHNPYNTVAAEEKLAELQAALINSPKMSEGEKYRFFDGFDFKAATEEDEEVMKVISDFLN